VLGVVCYLWYNNRYVGLNFKLDIGLYRLNQQVACQRYRQTTIDAKTPISNAVDKVLALRESMQSKLAFAPALV
jgi:hypothetical protein